MEFDFDGYNLVLAKARYRRDRIALMVVTVDGGPYAFLTVNVLSEPLAQDEMCIKTWDGQKGIVDRVFESGIFEDTGRQVKCGYISAPVWRIKDRTAFASLPELG